MSSTALRTFRTALGTFRQAGVFLTLTSLLLPSAAQAQTQPIDPSAGLPTITASFNHTSIVAIAGTLFDFNYYDFSITGFKNVGANNSAYAIFSFSNSTLEKQSGVVGVATSYLPMGWSFDDSRDFDISTGLIGILPDDPQFGLIFIQGLNTTPIDPTGALFKVFHQVGGVDPFTLNGAPLTVQVNAPVPEASTTVSLSLLLLLGLGGVSVAAHRQRHARKASAPTL